MQNIVNLVIFASNLHDNGSVSQSRQPLFEGIRRFARLEVTYPSMLSTLPSSMGGWIDGIERPGENIKDGERRKTVCFIATGGTEEMFRDYVDVLPRPVLLLSDGLHNSFAASFEIQTYLEQRGIASTLLNAPLDYDEAFFEDMERKLFGDDAGSHAPCSSDPLPRLKRSTLKGFEKSRIGLIGSASGWLISSGIDRKAVEAQYGTKFIDIPLRELEDAFAETQSDNPATAGLRQKMESYLTGDRTPDDLREAARMYLALRQLVSKYSLTALTLKCFGILRNCRTTACLAFALLNDDGIVAGCEGDIPALWSMIYVRNAYGQQGFMANPASSNRRELTIDFAHCTIPLGMVHGYRLHSHFESGMGIGVAGSVPSGRYRIVKIFGEKLDQYYETEGDLIMNTNIPQRCRTQVRFRFPDEEAFDRFFSLGKGNHIILCKAAR